MDVVPPKQVQANKVQLARVVGLALQQLLQVPSLALCHCYAACCPPW